MFGRAVLASALLACLPLTTAAAEGPPAASMQFGGEYAEGLSQGRHVMTNCAVTWTDKDGKVYCWQIQQREEVLPSRIRTRTSQQAREFMAAATWRRPRRRCRIVPRQRCRNPREGTTSQTKTRPTRPYPRTRTRARRSAEARLRRHRLHPHHRRLRLLPDVKFHDAADPQEIPDRLLGHARRRQLTIEETHVSKEPLQVEGRWTTMERQPVPWWWIPASEHPGHIATKRGWEVMSAVERNALPEREE